jgi:hypothetical protein
MSCSPRRATTAELGSCARPYTLYARQVKREQASEWRAERAAAGEQPGVPFYRPGRGLRHQLAFGVLSHATMVLRGRWTVVDGATRSRGRWILGMHGRCLILHGGRHASEYVCVHATKVLLVLHVCMSYLYVCMCGCTTDTCLLVLCMLVVHARFLCALLICIVNGKSGCCLGWCFVLLCAYTNVLLPCMEKKEEEKDGRWDPLSWRRASCRSRRGGPSAGVLRRRWWWGRRTCRYRASGETRERRNGRVMPMPRSKI